MLRRRPHDPGGGTAEAIAADRADRVHPRADAIAVEAQLIADWLAGRSLARGLPAPVADRGGLRVDTGTQGELSRWVFVTPSPAITALTAGIRRPGHVVKLAGPSEALALLLTPGWRVDSENRLMTRDGPVQPTAGLPPGYRWMKHRRDGVTHLRIVAANGLLAASGHVAQARGAFVYDRILTAPDHRRRGLGSAMMARLATFRTGDAREVLTATPVGRALYLTLGWRDSCPWTTAVFTGD